MIHPEIPYFLQDVVQRELEPGERVEWAGMPKAMLFTPAASGAFLFGIPWTAFAIFWTIMAAGGMEVFEKKAPGLEIVFPLFGVPFILIGFGMLSVPFWARRNARRTVYVITDRRAITFDGGRSTTIRSYPPEKLQNLFRREKADGSGDVIISNRAWRNGEDGQRLEDLGFMRVRNVQEVERRLKQLAEQSDRRLPSAES